MPHTRQLNIRLSEKDYELLKELALENRKTISDLIRELVAKEEQEHRKKKFQEAVAFSRKFAKERGLKEEDLIAAIMESRYGEEWKNE
ncbi:MAG: ribbon-helix-helix protein, CopG family [Candidatus Eremiobacteraeota bacterium]|nr:ribbon-helix-helix protein, CopG family [Candidatus Eremiobacteraeota bacterium]